MNVDGVRIRPAAAVDFDVGEIVRLESLLFVEDAGRHEPFADVTWPQRSGAADAAALIASPKSVVLLATEGDAAVGVLMAYAVPSAETRVPMSSAVLRTMYVDTAHRSAGVGGMLVDTFFEWARKQGCAEAQVNHYSANDAAGRFYARHGFAPHSLQRTRLL